MPPYRDGIDLITRMDTVGFSKYLSETGNTVCGRHPIAVCLFMLTAFAIFVLKHPRFLQEFNFASLANILISCAVALAFAYVYERGSEKARAGLMVIASTDPLTRLANLYRFRESFQQERHRAQRYNADLTLLVLDLDLFTEDKNPT